ncbi:hypothetical protein ABID30_001472 [Enterococcus rotai]|uniref:Uncharacterized protein n=1 Tax=Enterococcus rotai TaxID=118060 RepID=A0A0U2VIV6_9ENTE|nr:hypothetical protein [Enterococcus rotai]ALS37500.1 hypothetical protein ATZ35_10150 [Enterococcus rotai]
MFITDTSGNFKTGNLFYNKETHEFISTPSLNSDITFLVGYINIGFDSETKTATQVWGFHHDFNWMEKRIDLPEIVKGTIELNSDVKPGESIRIKESSSWKTYFDNESGWVRFGLDKDFSETTLVEFFTDTVAEIDEAGNLVSLLLKPVFN